MNDLEFEFVTLHKFVLGFVADGVSWDEKKDRDLGERGGRVGLGMNEGFGVFGWFKMHE